MTDILVSDNGFGKSTYDQIKYEGLKYTNLNNLEDLQEEWYRFIHFCVPYDERFFYRLRQCIDMADRVKVIIIHEPVEYDSLIKFQRRTKMPIIYVPHGVDETIWYWSMIGEFSDALFVPFTKILDNAGIKEEHHVMIGL